MKDTDTCTIDEQEWKVALRKLELKEEFTNGKTRVELQEIWNLGSTWTKKRISEMLENGTLERGVKKVRNTMGVLCTTPAYRLVKK